MGKASRHAVVLDASALIAFERADQRMRALVNQALRTGTKLIVPASVLGQVWRDASRQVVLRSLIRGPTTVVPALDRLLAEAAGILCGRTPTTEVVDASVAWLGYHKRRE